MEKEIVYLENIKQDIKTSCFRNLKIWIFGTVMLFPILAISFSIALTNYFTIIHKLPEYSNKFVKQMLIVTLLTSVFPCGAIVGYIRYKIILKNFYIVKARYKGMQYYPFFGEYILGMRFLGYRFYNVIGYKIKNGDAPASTDATIHYYKWSKLGHISEHGVKRSADVGDIFYLAIYKRKIYAIYNTDLFKMHESVEIVDEYGLKY